MCLKNEIKVWRFYYENYCAYKHRFSQDYDLASHNTYVVCVYFYTWVAGSTVQSRLRMADYWEALSW